MHHAGQHDAGSYSDRRYSDTPLCMTMTEAYASMHNVEVKLRIA